MQPARLFLITAAAALVLTVGVVAQRPATAGTGTLSGTVTADAARCGRFAKARNTATRIAYTVFTVKGRYQIHNLPAGPHEVQVVEEAFESPVQKVQLGERQTADRECRVKMKAAFARGAGNAGSIAQTSYGATPQDKADLSQVELVDFDTLYPPSPARDLMVQHCFPATASPAGTVVG